MIKKSLAVLSISAAFYIQAQDVSNVRNTLGVYSGSTNEGTAKFNAMAGATGALGGDATSLFNNPAGLGVAISSEITGTLLLSNYTNKSSLYGNSASYSNSNFNIGNVGGVATFQLLTETPWKFVNLGFNYSGESLDDYIETPGLNTIQFGNAINNLELNRHAYDRRGLKSKMNIGVGANYDNNIYFGAGLNFHTVELDQFDTAEFKVSDIATNKVFFEQFAKQYTPFSEKASGFSMSLGALGKLPGGFRWGAALETPTWWHIERVFNYYEINGSDGVAAENRNLRTPLKATLSAGYVASKNFSMNIDYTIGITKPHYKVRGAAETEMNDFFSDHANNVSEIKAGAEYRIKDFRIRGGYAFASNPVSPVSMNTYRQDGSDALATYNNLFASSRNTVGLGIGYNFKSFYVDAAYQHSNTKYNSPFLFGYNDGNINSSYYSSTSSVDSESSAVADVQNKRNNFSVTFGWKF